MKGLLISLLALAGFVLTSAGAAWCFRPRRYLKLFAITFLLWIPIYFVLYRATPPDLCFLPSAWMCTDQRVDMLYGFVVFALNWHSVVDSFTGIIGGFSVALLVATRNSPAQQTTTTALIANFKLEDGADRIYNWRLPELERLGYVVRTAGDGTYRLTAKGRWVARIAWFAKRSLNLSVGG